MILLYSVLSFVVSFVILYSTRRYLARGQLVTGDTYFHLIIIESIKKNRWKYPTSLQNIQLNEIDKDYDYLAYPPLFHYLSAMFPMKYQQKIAKYFSIVILSFLSSLITVLVYDLTSNPIFAILSSLIAVINFSALSLVIQFSPRPLGLFFYSLLMCIAIFYPNHYLSLLVIALLVAVISLTHKFAVQVLIFSFVPFVLLFGNLYLLLSLMLGFLLSTLLSRGFYLRILKEHVSWLVFYKSRPLKTRITTNLTQIFTRNIWFLPIIISIFFILLQINGIFPENLIESSSIIKLIYWSFINILLACLISIPVLSFLGEYYRYVEYSIVPIGITASLFLMNLNPLLLFVSFLCIAISLLALMKFKKYLLHSGSIVDADDILSYGSLKDYGINNLLVFPGNRTLEVGYYSRVNVIHPVRGATTPSEHITNLINSYEIDCVLKFRDTDRYDLFATISKLLKMTKIADFKNFELYRVV